MNKAIIDPACDNLIPGEVSPVPPPPPKEKPSFLSFSESFLTFSFFFLVVQVLCLGLVGHDCTTVHVVQDGDSCPTIASNAKITVGELLTDNPNVNANCTNIIVGEVSKKNKYLSLTKLYIIITHYLCIDDTRSSVLRRLLTQLPLNFSLSMGAYTVCSISLDSSGIRRNRDKK